ncbi:hypothetical protein [Jannaschia faecimaris]|nr:hypothetical protein [Jannaschia faecimaris]
MPNTYQPVDDDSRALAETLLRGAAHAALGTLRDGAPMVTRVGCLWMSGQGLGLLLSDLSDHARSLAEDARCSALTGEPASRGDPLNHPRLTLLGQAEPVDKATHRDTWLAARPKAALYYDFTDFRLHILRPTAALLNGGFGKAFRLSGEDLGVEP